MNELNIDCTQHSRRQALRTLAQGIGRVGAIGLLPFANPAALAQSSDKPLRIIVPFPAGGTADVLPRALSDSLRAHYPAGIVIENRAGAGGNIGAEAVYRAEPDGLTLLASPPGPVAVNHNLYSKLSFDPTRWSVVTVLATVPTVLATSNKLGLASLPELIAYGKAHPNRLTYASQGNGSTSHLTAALFMSQTGIQMTHVPYKGTAPALVDLIAGHVDLFFDNLGSSLPQHQAGKLRVLAVADEKRAVSLPSVATMAEQGLEQMQAAAWFALVAPPATPPAVLVQLNKLVGAALNEPTVRAKFAEQSAEVRGWSSEQSTQFIQNETQKWLKVIKSANVKAD